MGIDSRLLAERLGHDMHATTPHSIYLFYTTSVGYISFITLHFRAHSSAQRFVFHFSLSSKGKQMTPAVFFFWSVISSSYFPRSAFTIFFFLFIPHPNCYEPLITLEAVNHHPIVHHTTEIYICITMWYCVQQYPV